MTEKEWIEWFSDNLKVLMEEHGISQSELAYYAKVADSTIHRILNKEVMPTVKTVVNISYVFGVDVAMMIDFGTPIE